jgi:hypothetical protein
MRRWYAVRSANPDDWSDPNLSETFRKHAREAKALGMCPQLHLLADDGTCPEGCTVPGDDEEDDGQARTMAVSSSLPPSQASSSALMTSARLVF